MSDTKELKSEVVYRRLKRAIATHELAPSQKISENLLVRDYGFGKAAVRAAIGRLTDDGLIVSRSPKLQTVAPLTMSDIRQTFHLRNLLEPEAARLAAGRANIERLRELNATCQQPYRFGDGEQEYAFLLANGAFHLAIAQAAGLPRLTHWITQLHDQAVRILWVSLKVENRPEVWSHGHDEIIDALARGSGDIAAAIAKRHLHAGQRLVFEILSSFSSLNDVDVTTSSIPLPATGTSKDR